MELILYQSPLQCNPNEMNVSILITHLQHILGFAKSPTSFSRVPISQPTLLGYSVMKSINHYLPFRCPLNHCDVSLCIVLLFFKRPTSVFLNTTFQAITNKSIYFFIIYVYRNHPFDKHTSQWHGITISYLGLRLSYHLNLSI